MDRPGFDGVSEIFSDDKDADENEEVEVDIDDNDDDVGCFDRAYRGPSDCFFEENDDDDGEALLPLEDSNGIDEREVSVPSLPLLESGICKDEEIAAFACDDAEEKVTCVSDTERSRTPSFPAFDATACDNPCLCDAIKSCDCSAIDSNRTPLFEEPAPPCADSTAAPAIASLADEDPFFFFIPSSSCPRYLPAACLPLSAFRHFPQRQHKP